MRSPFAIVRGFFDRSGPSRTPIPIIMRANIDGSPQWQKSLLICFLLLLFFLMKEKERKNPLLY